MSDKPFFLNIVSIKLIAIDHIEHHYVKPGTDGLQLVFYFGGSKIETGKIKYLQQNEEILLQDEYIIQSISAKKIEIWFTTYSSNKFLGATEISLDQVKSENQNFTLNLSVDFHIIASLRVAIRISFIRKDIHQIIEFEPDEIILKKDDSELSRQQQLEKQRELQQKREQEEAEALRRAQTKMPIILLSTKEKQNQVFL